MNEIQEVINEKEKESSDKSSYFHYPIIGEDDDKVDSLDNIDIEKVYKMKDKRSKLQTSTIVNWLRSRGGKHVKKFYLYFPDELIKNIEIKQIFSTFDKDGSKSLDRGELEEMFNRYQFKISKSDLKGLFKIVDDDKDDALNLKEFKKCALNQDANITFTNIMRKLRRNRLEAKFTDQEFKYLPMFFESMISYLSYKLNRDETLQSLQNEDIPISDKLKKYLDLLELTSRFGSNSALQKKNDKDNVDLTHLSISSATNTPKLNIKVPSINKMPSMGSMNRIPSTNHKKPVSPVAKPTVLKSDDPTKNFSTYFNKMRYEEKIQDKKTNLREFKKELKMIIKDAKQKAIRETTEKINKDFRPKQTSFTNLTLAKAQIVLNKDFKFNSSFYKNLIKSKKIEPLRHLSNLSKVIESSFKNDQPKIDEILPKMKFPLPNDLRNIDNVIYENYKDNEHKFLTWDSKKKALGKMNSQGNKKVQEMKKELDELNEIAKTKYGINIPKPEYLKEENDAKNLLFKLQPEFLNSKIINYDSNSIDNYKPSTISQHKNTVSFHDNAQKSLNEEEKMDDSSVPEFLLQNVFLANKEMKNFRIGHSQTQVKQQRAFMSQNSMRNPYKTKGQFNFSSTFSGNFKK